MSQGTLQRLAIAAAITAILATPVLAGPTAAVASITVYMVDPITRAEIPLTTGSGALVSADGTIITAKHVVEYKMSDVPGRRKYFVSFGSRALQFPAQHVFECAGGAIDLCILNISSVDVRTALVDEVFTTLCKQPAVQERVTSFGFPPGEFMQVTQTNGIISSGPAEGRKYASDITIVPGMSGGPVVWENFLIGVNVGATNGTLAFIQEIRSAKSLLADAGVSCPETPAGLDPSSGSPQPEPSLVGAAATEEFRAEPGSAADPNSFSISPPRLNPGGGTSDAELTICASVVKDYQMSVPAMPAASPVTFLHELRAADGCEFTDIDWEFSNGSDRVEQQGFSRSADRRELRIEVAVLPDTILQANVGMSLAVGQRPVPRGPTVVVETPTSIDGPGFDDDAPFGGWSTGFSGEPIFLPSEAENSDQVLQMAANVGADFFPPPTFNVECPTKFVVIDRIEGPVTGKKSPPAFSEVVNADPACRVAFVDFGTPIVAAPGYYVHSVLADDGKSVELLYGFGAPEKTPRQLWVVAKIVQSPDETVWANVDAVSVPTPAAPFGLPEIAGSIEAAHSFDVDSLKLAF